MGSVLCEHCTAVCCNYIALPIEKPTTRRDFDDIRWYVMHAGISVFVEDGDWYLQVATRCDNLQPDNLCRIYTTRPAICREYKAGECDYEGGDYHYEVHFKSPEEVEAYAIEKLGRRGAFRQSTNGRARKAGSNGSVKSLKVIFKK